MWVVQVHLLSAKHVEFEIKCADVVEPSCEVGWDCCLAHGKEAFARAQQLEVAHFLRLTIVLSAHPPPPPPPKQKKKTKTPP